ncbi:hypothetical protein [Ornithinimicrobium cryptoxanthini]|uniref:hypothetical protein n=1 Tax=Ornithinimicrobium cryptoxanthini TaxID=2934161 RepID=UPI0021183D91|nr:hypothetical protein [Ornithinimicrobium cryptoxanthini]
MSYTANGQHLVPGQQLGTGGEGTVFRVPQRPEMVAKVFRPDKRTPERIAKIRAMVAHKPEPRATKSKVYGVEIPTIAWPEEILYENGSVVGFLMRALDHAHTVSIWKLESRAESKELAWGIPIGLGIRSYIAMNLAFSVSRLHAIDVVIGDINHSNAMVSKSLIVSIIDCDSMQIRDTLGRYHYCEAFTPGFLAPELHASLNKLGSTVRTPYSDLFTLAVHIYSLLLECHPFQNGKYHGPGDKPGGDALARSGQWRGRVGGVLRATEKGQQDPAVLLPSSMMVLFRRAFEAGVSKPHERPSAVEWQRELRTFLGDWRPAA